MAKGRRHNQSITSYQQDQIFKRLAISGREPETSPGRGLAAQQVRLYHNAIDQNTLGIAGYLGYYPSRADMAAFTCANYRSKAEDFHRQTGQR